jgi:hypothetical protein
MVEVELDRGFRRLAEPTVGEAANAIGDHVTVRWLRSSPTAHFVALGTALFVLERYATPPWSAPRPTVVVSAARLMQLRAAASRGAAAASSEDAAILAQAGDEAILLREALALGIDRDDQSIRGRLTEKMRFLAGNDDHSATHAHSALALQLDRRTLVRGLLVQKMRLLLGERRLSSRPTMRRCAHVEEHPGATHSRRGSIAPSSSPAMVPPRGCRAGGADTARSLDQASPRPMPFAWAILWRAGVCGAIA